MTIWNFHTRKPRKCFKVRALRSKSGGPGVRPTIMPSRLRPWRRSSGLATRIPRAEWQAKEVARIGPEARVFLWNISL